MNVKRMAAYGVYYVIFLNVLIFLSIGLLDYFDGYNWKSIITVNILAIFVIIPIHGKVKKYIDKNFPEG